MRVLLVLVLSLAGCATPGPTYDPAFAAKYEVTPIPTYPPLGTRLDALTLRTTQDDILKRCGSPTSKDVTKSGESIWTYVLQKTITGKKTVTTWHYNPGTYRSSYGSADVPVYNQVKLTIVLTFQKDGLLTGWSFNGHTDAFPESPLTSLQPTRGGPIGDPPPVQPLSAAEIAGTWNLVKVQNPWWGNNHETKVFCGQTLPFPVEFERDIDRIGALIPHRAAPKSFMLWAGSSGSGLWAWSPDRQNKGQVLYLSLSPDKRTLTAFGCHGRSFTTLYRLEFAREPESVQLAKKGWELHLQGKSEGAEELLRRSLELDPKSVDVRVKLATVLRTLARPKEALPIADQGLGLKPNDPALISQKGYALVEMRQPEAGLAELRKADQLLGGKGFWVKMYLAKGHTALKQYAKAREHIDGGLACAPDPFHKSHAQLERGMTHWYSGKFDLAEGDYRQAVALHPKNHWALYWLANAVQKRSLHEEALRYYDRCIALYPRDGWRWSARGVSRAALGRHREAIADFTEAVKRLPTSPWFFEHRARSKEKLGDKAGATADRERAKRLKEK